MPEQRELLLSFPELSAEIPQISVRMVNEVVYRPLIADSAVINAVNNGEMRPTDFVRAAASQAAAERGLTAPVITLSRSLIVPFLSLSTRRDLRETAWRAWIGRGEQAGECDNRPIAARILALRQRQAGLMGCANYADFKLADTMALSPD